MNNIVYKTHSIEEKITIDNNKLNSSNNLCSSKKNHSSG